MRNFPPLTVGTEPYEFDPSGDGRRLKYMRVKSIAGGATAYMGPKPLVTQVVITHVVLLTAGTTRLKLADYELVSNGVDPDPTVAGYVQPGWIISDGADAGVRVKRVYDGYIEFDSPLSTYADDSISMSPPYELDYFNGFPILSPDDVTISDISLLEGPIWFATASGTATLHILFELT